ncbi:MFS transporter [Gorillibacterium sp. sgz5001074]|uniref:MFS transporter n=1 Tax=Gorillibacterium sp. sgz5001074 TaxID=3446695 RepID=UPI003F665621
MRTAIWLYLFMFVAFFDLHAQYPILTPFAVSLGAAPSFIGLILGVYSITHLPGNLIAGFGVDRYGSKGFIVTSLILAGVLLLFQSRVTDPWELLAVRSISGFVLAFLSPACLALLAKLARDHIHRSKLMSGNGLVHTLASVVSPAAGAYLVAKIGFTTAFTVLGWGLIVTGVLAIFGIREASHATGVPGERFAPHPHGGRGTASAGDQLPPPATDRGIPWLFFALPLAISCSQGILFFELPMLNHHDHGHSAASAGSILTSGILFSLVSLGALLSLSMVFLNRFSPLSRTVTGCFLLAMVFFLMAVDAPISLYILLFLIGMSKGVIFPAIASLLGSATHATRYGRAYSVLSIAYSIGSFIGPVAAGHFRESLSSYFIAFFVLMLGLIFLPLERLRLTPAGETPAA